MRLKQIYGIYYISRITTKYYFCRGGGALQFSAVPMNLMKNGVADYIVTGQWAKRMKKERNTEKR